MKKKKAVKSEKRFEDYLKIVEDSIQKLEEGEVDLEKSIDIYYAAMQALKRCYEIIDKLEKKVEQIEVENLDAWTTKPLKNDRV